MLRRLLSIFLALLTVQICTVGNSCLAKAEDASSLLDGNSQIFATNKNEPPTFFKAGVKYDPSEHSWVDRKSGKKVSLGLPGVMGRYGDQTVVADSDVVAQSPGPTTTTSGGTTYHIFTFKNFIIVTFISLGVATAIMIPVIIGHHHHNASTNTNQFKNQYAIFSYFHNQGITPPKLILPPPPPPHIEGGGGGQGPPP